MSDKRRRKQPKIPRDKLFVRFEFWEMETEAFEHLSGDATRVYLFMRKRYNGSNNGTVVFSHRDAQKVLRSDWRRASRALGDLQQLGFIKCRNRGEPGPNIRLASEWQLTVFECGGQEASKDFARWQKQLPIGEMPTPRRRNADAPTPPKHDSDTENAQTVGEMPTLPPYRRRRNADTCRYTTQGGPEKQRVLPRAAPPSAGLCTSEASLSRPLEWRSPRLVEIPRGPSPGRFGAWLEEQGRVRGVPPGFVAEALGVTVDQLAHMTHGIAQWTRYQSRRAEAALVKHELGLTARPIITVAKAYANASAANAKAKRTANENGAPCSGRQM